MRVTIVTNMKDGSQRIGSDITSFDLAFRHIMAHVNSGHANNVLEHIIISSDGNVSKVDANGKGLGFMKMEENNG